MNGLFILPLPQPLPARTAREHDLIQARIASAAHWRRRRRWPQLHAALFGRAKLGFRLPGEPAARPALG